MHHLGFSSHGKGDKLRTQPLLAKQYLRKAAQKLEEEAEDVRKKVAVLLRGRHTTPAFAQAEVLVCKQKQAAGYNELTFYCDRIISNATLLENSTKWPVEVEEAVSTIICAYKLWGVKELGDTSETLKRCNRAFANAAQCSTASRVNRQMEGLLAPGKQCTAQDKMACLHEIARAERIPISEQWAAELNPLSASSSSASSSSQPAKMCSSIPRTDPAPSTPRFDPTRAAQPNSLQRGASAPNPDGGRVMSKSESQGHHHQHHHRTQTEGGSYFPSISGPSSSANPPQHLRPANPALGRNPSMSASQQRIDEHAEHSPRGYGYGYGYGDRLAHDVGGRMTLSHKNSSNSRRQRSSAHSFDVLPRENASSGVHDDRGATSLDYGRHPRRASQPNINFQPAHATSGTFFDTGGARPFSFEEVIEVTSEWQYKIGKGGFGMVYYGKLDGPRERQVAVKRKTGADVDESNQFQNEVATLSLCRHRHLVNLLGYCFENNEEILIYEFMAKGTLGDHLFPRKEVTDDRLVPASHALSWRMRLNILLGAARGLAYLHHESSSDAALIHRDVKAGNVLLDDKFEAKLADFGLCKYTPDEFVETNIKGTLGYLDPEYFSQGTVTAKSDVFSFGVLILVAIAGREAIDRKQAPEAVNLVIWATPFLEADNVQGILDHRLKGTRHSADSLSVVGDLALKCVAYRGEDRPTMKKVVRGLEDALELEDEWLGDA